MGVLDTVVLFQGQLWGTEFTKQSYFS